MDEILRVEDLTKQMAGRDILKSLNFSIQFGEVVGLLGSNDSGKTTTLLILAGLMGGTSGRIYFRGRSVLRCGNFFRTNSSFLSAESPLPDDASVSDYLAFRAHMKRLSDPKASMDEVLQSCDLNRRARHRPIGSLSRGARQRVRIADALLGRPDLLLLDDPTVGLDARQLAAFTRLLEDLRGRSTVILSGHRLDFIQRTCNRLLLLERGRLVADGTPDQLMERLGQRPIWKIRVRWRNDGAPDQAVHLRQGELRVLDEEWVGNHGTVTIQLPEGEEDQAILIRDLASNAAFDLLEVHRHVPSLESLVLAAMNHDRDNSLP